VVSHGRLERFAASRPPSVLGGFAACARPTPPQSARLRAPQGGVRRATAASRTVTAPNDDPRPRDGAEILTLAP